VFTVRIATAADVDSVADILAEASAWADTRGAKLWQIDELNAERIAAEVGRGLFFVVSANDEPTGTLKFQLDDPEFWPDDPGPHAAYIHRLAIRRRFAGGAVSAAMMAWAATRARAGRRRVLRLDCDSERTSLRAVYERFGFAFHSFRQVGPYHVARYEFPIPP
jgi:hypothetical protein